MIFTELAVAPDAAAAAFTFDRLMLSLPRPVLIFTVPPAVADPPTLRPERSTRSLPAPVLTLTAAATLVAPEIDRRLLPPPRFIVRLPPMLFAVAELSARETSSFPAAAVRTRSVAIATSLSDNLSLPAPRSIF